MRTAYAPAAAGLLTSLACAGWPVAEGTPPVVLAPAPQASGDLVISPGFEHALHARRDGGAWVVTLDGEPLTRQVEAVGEMGFLPDGTPHVAYRQGTSWYRMLGARKLGPYQQLGDLVGAAGHSAFQAKRSGRWHTVVDGTNGASWEMTSPALIEASGHAAWLGLQDGRTVVLKDGRELATADEAFLRALTDGRLAWAGRAGSTWRVWLDTEPLPDRWEQVGHVALGESWAYTARDRAGWWVVTERAKHGPFADTGPVRFAPDGRLIWYEGTEAGWRLHVGDWSGPLVREIGDSSPVLQGHRILWWSRDDGATVWLGDEPVARVAEVADLPPWFAGEAVAFAGRDAEGWRVWVGDHVTRPAHELARAVTSDDGQWLALVLRDTDGWGVDLYRVGADAPVGSWRAPVATDRGGGVRFVEDALWFTAIEGDQLVRREIPLSGAPR